MTGVLGLSLWQSTVVFKRAYWWHAPSLELCHVYGTAVINSGYLFRKTSKQTNEDSFWRSAIGSSCNTSFSIHAAAYQLISTLQTVGLTHVLASNEKKLVFFTPCAILKNKTSQNTKDIFTELLFQLTHTYGCSGSQWETYLLLLAKVKNFENKD